MKSTTLPRKYDERYGKPAARPSAETSRSWPRHRHHALAFIPGAGNVLLDVGCGDGEVLWIMRHRYQTLLGTELSGIRLAKCAKLLKGFNFEGRQAVGDALDVIDSCSVDRALSSDVLEHIVDVYFHTEELYRVLKPGGDLIVNTPNVACIHHRLGLLRGRFPATGTSDQGFGSDELYDGGHLHYFTFYSLSRLLVRSGFEIVGRMGFGRLGRLHNFCSSLLSGSVQIHARKPLTVTGQ